MPIRTPEVGEGTYEDLFERYEELLDRARVQAPSPERAAELGQAMVERDLTPDALLALHREALRRHPELAHEPALSRASDLLFTTLNAYAETTRTLAKQRLEEVERLERYAKALESFNEDMRRLNQELQQQKADLSRARDDLERLANQKSDLLSTVSHEIRTPLTSLLGYGEFLEEGLYGELNPQQIEVLRRMVQGGRDLLELINNLLDLAKLEANRIELHCEPVRLNILVSNAIEKIQPIAQRKGVALEALPIPEDFPLVEVDAMRIIQVLVNLIGNAVKFTEPGGSVSVGATLSGERAEVFVKDTGIGISAEEQKRLFERFMQAEQLQRYGGTGLGLAISRELLALHGGRIWVESIPNEGATFTFTLPLWKPSE